MLDAFKQRITANDNVIVWTPQGLSKGVVVGVDEVCVRVCTGYETRPFLPFRIARL